MIMGRVKALTTEEIQSLQVDAALRLMGENTRAMAEISAELGQALIELGQAKLKVDTLKEDKRTIIEINKALGAIAKFS